jgi:hypothetical protein
MLTNYKKGCIHVEEKPSLLFKVCIIDVSLIINDFLLLLYLSVQTLRSVN